MELKEINELKEQWLSAFPDSAHTLTNVKVVYL